MIDLNNRVDYEMDALEIINNTRKEIETNLDQNIKIYDHIAILKDGKAISCETVIAIRRGRDLNGKGFICSKSRKYYHLKNNVTGKTHWVNSAYFDFFSGFTSRFAYRFVIGEEYINTVDSIKSVKRSDIF